MLTKLFPLKLTLIGSVFFLLGFLLMYMRWHHDKLGPHTEGFELFLLALDVIIGVIFILRLLGYAYQIIHKS